MQRRTVIWCVAVALPFALSMPDIAHADDGACIAASEAEATLQKAVKLHEALKQAAICADPSCPVDVKNECGERIARMNADMPTVILSATDESGNDLLAVTVMLDGAPLVTTLDGKAISIDPGSHVLVFSSAGKPTVEKAIVLRQAEKDRRVDVRLGVNSGAVVPPPAGVPESSVSSGSTWTTRKTLALVAGGVGVVGLGVGAGLGASAISSWSSAKNECNATSCPASTRANAESDRSAAVTTGDVSTVAIVVGAAALAGGVYLWLSAPKTESSPVPAQTGLRLYPTFGAGTAGMLLGGSFQ